MDDWGTGQFDRALILECFPFLDAASVELILQEGRLVSLKRDTVFIQQNIRGAHVFLICRGRVECFKRQGSKTLTFGDHGPGSVLGDVAGVLDVPSSISVCTIESTVAITIAKETFMKLLDHSHPLCLHLLRHSYHQLLAADTQRMQLCSDSVATRVLRFIETFQTTEIRHQELPSHSAIARHIGTSREVVTRSLRRLEREGKIRRS